MNISVILFEIILDPNSCILRFQNERDQTSYSSVLKDKLMKIFNEKIKNFSSKSPYSIFEPINFKQIKVVSESYA